MEHRSVSRNWSFPDNDEAYESSDTTCGLSEGGVKLMQRFSLKMMTVIIDGGGHKNNI